jgi:hypothetical protein
MSDDTMLLSLDALFDIWIDRLASLDTTSSMHSSLLARKHEEAAVAGGGRLPSILHSVLSCGIGVQ